MPASCHGASSGISCRPAMRALFYLTTAFVAVVFACPASRAVSPGVPRVEPEPQPFSFAVRDARYVARVSGMRVPMYAPGARWRIVAAASTQEFRRRLEAIEESDGPCDLVFPLVDFGRGFSARAPDKPVMAHKGLLFSGFPPIALPAPGLEMRIDSLGEWSSIERAAAAALLLTLPDGVTQRLTALNSGGATGLQGWTRGFGPFARSLVYGSPQSGETWAILQPSRGATASDPALWSLAGGTRRTVSPDMLPRDGLALRIEGAPSTHQARMRCVARLEGEALPPSSVAAVGGLHSLVRDGKTAVAPEAAGIDRPYAWIGFSRSAGLVWLGVCDLNGARSRGMRPEELAPVLARNHLDAAGILPAVVGGPALRWRGEWTGQVIGKPLAHMSAALLLHLGPRVSRPTDLLRNRRVHLETSNVSESGRNTAALHDGRTLAGTRLDTFWWARPADASKPLVAEIDLNESKRVRRIELRGASASGFSEQFDPPSWRWFVRDSSSSPWRVVASGASRDIAAGIWEHRFGKPVHARRWRLEVDAPKGRGVVRIAEICLWEDASP